MALCATGCGQDTETGRPAAGRTRGGRPPLYCSRACQARAYRARQAATPPRDETPRQATPAAPAVRTAPAVVPAPAVPVAEPVPEPAAPVAESASAAAMRVRRAVAAYTAAGRYAAAAVDGPPPYPVDVLLAELAELGDAVAAAVSAAAPPQS